MEAVDRDGDQRAAKRRRRTRDADEFIAGLLEQLEMLDEWLETHTVFVADPIAAAGVRSGAVPSTPSTSTAAHGDEGWFYTS